MLYDQASEGIRYWSLLLVFETAMIIAFSPFPSKILFVCVFLERIGIPAGLNFSSAFCLEVEKAIATGSSLSADLSKVSAQKAVLWA